MSMEASVSLARPYPWRLEPDRVEKTLGAIMLPVGLGLAGACVWYLGPSGYVIGFGHFVLWTWLFLTTLRSVTVEDNLISARLILRRVIINKDEINSYVDSGFKNPKITFLLKNGERLSIPNYNAMAMKSWLSGVTGGRAR